MSPMQQMFLGLGAVAEKTYVEDLFSTYLYRGDASTIVVNNGVALGSSMSGNSANLSNTLDANKLNRTSAMTGVSAGKTFTVSAWVFIPNTSTYGELFYIDTGSQTRFELGFGNYISIAARNSSNTKFLDVYTPSNVPITPGKWNHILVSMDLTNTSNRHVYVNDSSVSMTYDGYGNENILFNESKVSIFGQDGNMNLLFGYLSNFYFDQTYRDLGTTSNRRLFYAADGTPATGQASLSPVIYYKFDTLSTTNAGSGGDFTWSGSPTLATFGPYKDTDAANGGLVWIKNRETSGYGHFLFDTERGTTKAVCTNLTNAEFTEAKGVKDFNVNGFTIGGASGDAAFNGNNTDYASFTFRKAPGFFDVVTYTGTGSALTINHNLGCIPGMIIVKCTSAVKSWVVYNRGVNGGVNPEQYAMFLNGTGAQNQNIGYWNNTAPTATQFTLGDSAANENGESHVAYLFAGGESTAATARSVDFDGSGDYLTVAGPGALGTSTDFTMECWVYLDDNAQGTHHRIFSANEAVNGTELTQFRVTGGEWNVYIGASGDRWTWSGGTASVGQWYHLALVRHGTTNAFYVNGVLQSSATGSHSVTITTLVIAGGYGTENINGKVSNARFVNGTAVYTSSFKPPTEPLTSITNTTLLCCNDSSTTGKTTGGTITANGDPTASTDSPFDDTAGFVFGDSGSESVIKHGSYSGDGSKNQDIYLGWEPSWIMIKSTTASENWLLFDVMRGIVTGGNDGKDAQLYPNTTGAEVTSNYMLEATGTGFKLTQDQAPINSNGNDYIFTAIRRSDGYVGKPIELGTDVFAMDAGNSSAVEAFTSGFPVDFALEREIAATCNWEAGGRLIQGRYLQTNSTQAGSAASYFTFDSNTGWLKGAAAYNSGYQSWMWKRHAGMDVVGYKGDGVNGRSIAHSMNDVPEMMIVKRTSNTEDWTVYHTGLNGGTNPYTRLMTLNSTATEVDMTSTPEKVWKSTPTSTHFEIGSHDRVNTDGNYYLAFLFSTISGVSKVGYYTGTGSTGLSITVGFQPRFILFRGTNMGGPWRVLDSVRGMSSGNDKSLSLNTDAAQVTNFDWLDATSTGFTINTTDGEANASGKNYIYYAHA
jgi:hypothetical protein